MEAGWVELGALTNEVLRERMSKHPQILVSAININSLVQVGENYGNSGLSSRGSVRRDVSRSPRCVFYSETES